MEIFGEEWFIDLNEITEACKYDGELPNLEDDNGNIIEDENEVINIFKYEIIKMSIERILTNDIIDQDEDQMLSPINGNKKPVSFKLAFNTLTESGILKIKK